MCGTRSSLARSHKGRFEGENLKIGATGESNQKSERVNRIQRLSSFPDAQLRTEDGASQQVVPANAGTPA